MIDYIFYTETYHGTQIPEESFGIWADRANYKLDTLILKHRKDSFIYIIRK